MAKTLEKQVIATFLSGLSGTLSLP